MYLYTDKEKYRRKIQIQTKISKKCKTVSSLMSGSVRRSVLGCCARILRPTAPHQVVHPDIDAHNCGDNRDGIGDLHGGDNCGSGSGSPHADIDADNCGDTRDPHGGGILVVKMPQRTKSKAEENIKETTGIRLTYWFQHILLEDFF